MGYGRQTVMDGLRKAGQAFLDMDERYASAIYDGTGGDNSMKTYFGNVGMTARAAPIKELDRFTPTSEYEARGGYGPRDEASQRLGQGIDAGLIASNIASRYLLPAGGVTLAGKGLYDLTIGFGSEADETQPAQLPLY